MSESQQQGTPLSSREYSRPRGITCPEGIWVLQAIVFYQEKVTGSRALENEKAVDVAQDFIGFLLTTPAVEVFTVNSFDGCKKPIDRDYLRSRTALGEFVKGFIPFSTGIQTSATEGEYIFVDKKQFENFLNDRPIVATLVPKQVVSEKSLATRERETALKLIIGMAVKGYSYDPKASKSSIAKDISDDLISLGISVSDDTIRKWLKEATELLPPNREDPVLPVRF
jgi:hypothetical protein